MGHPQGHPHPQHRKHAHCATLAELQDLIGQAQAIFENDRDDRRGDKLRAVLESAFAICLAAREGCSPR